MDKLTAKQEKFAQLVAEGKTQSDAYREAYEPKTMSHEAIWVEASNTLKDPKVSLRVNELKEQTVKRNEITLDEIVNGFRDACSMARSKEDLNAMIRAYEQLGKIAGFYVEKKKVEGEMQFVIKVANEKDKQALEDI